MNNRRKTDAVVWGLSAAFLAMAVAFVIDPWGHAAPRPTIPLVNPDFLDQTPLRTSYSDWVRANEDVSEFDCLGCHEKDKPPVLRYDDLLQHVMPPEHENIELGHGSHGRNNNCYNCHNEANLATLSARDGLELSFAQSSQLCGSCHGPTMSDWDTGAHGRTNGYWDLSRGAALKLDCVNCHDPHTPRFPGRKPAPGPNPLHSSPTSAKGSPNPH